MKGENLNKLFNLGAKHALYREDGKWYHNLKRFPGALFDSGGYVIYKSEEAYRNDPALQIKKDLHVFNGISSLRSYRPFSSLENLYLRNPLIDTSEGDETTVRIRRVIEAIVRNRDLVLRIKKAYDNTCQICGIRLEIGNNKYYSEVHHIKPLGRHHCGPDKIENMICVCPNHHMQLDSGAIRINRNRLYALNHKISDVFIAYHNDMVYLKP